MIVAETDKQREQANKLAETNDAKCISGVDEEGKYTWQCASGRHTFRATYGHMRQSFQCKYCNKEARKQKRLEVAFTIAEKRGGQCLSEVYPNDSDNLFWECNEKHRWSASFYSVKNGSWCGTCARMGIGSNENETCFKPRKGRMGKAPKSVEDAQQLAAARQGKFLSAFYVNVKTKYEWQCHKGHTWPATYNDVQKRHWCPWCRKKSIEDAKRLAEQRGGEIVSTIYVNSTKKLIWQCAEGHTWPASFSSVQSGSWCPHCFGNARHTLEEMQKLAVERGGLCISKTYEGANKPLLWQCAEGHIWSTQLSVIQRGSWCRKCAVARQKKSIEDARRLAKEKGGICLSTIYMNAQEDMNWQCSKGHTWSAPYSRIRSGHWCPKCGRTGKRNRKGKSQTPLV